MPSRSPVDSSNRPGRRVGTFLPDWCWRSNPSTFELVTLYDLDYKSFQLAMDILKEWRLDRYYASKSKLYDLSGRSPN